MKVCPKCGHLNDELENRCKKDQVGLVHVKAVPRDQVNGNVGSGVPNSNNSGEESPEQEDSKKSSSNDSDGGTNSSSESLKENLERIKAKEKEERERKRKRREENKQTDTTKPSSGTEEETARKVQKDMLSELLEPGQQPKTQSNCPKCGNSNNNSEICCQTCAAWLKGSIACKNKTCNKLVPATALYCPSCRYPVAEKNCSNSICKKQIPKVASFCPYCRQSV